MPVRTGSLELPISSRQSKILWKFNAGHDYETFSQDKRTLKAVLYNLAVIVRLPAKF